MRSWCRPSWLRCTKYSGEAGRVWIAGLPALAAAYLDRWELAIDGRVASGAVALIIPVACRDGSQAVLKLQPGVTRQVVSLRHLGRWAGRGRCGCWSRTPVRGRCCSSVLLARPEHDGGRPGCRQDHRGVARATELCARASSMRRLTDVAAATLAGVPDAIRLVEDPEERQLLINRRPLPGVDHRPDR